MQHVSLFDLFKLNYCIKFEIKVIKGELVHNLSDSLEPSGGLVEAWVANLNGTVETHREDKHCEDVLENEHSEVDRLVYGDSIVLDLLLVVCHDQEHDLEKRNGGVSNEYDSGYDLLRY